MITKTIRLYFRLNKRVLQTMTGFALENQEDISEIIASANEAIEVFKSESDAYTKHSLETSEILKSTFFAS
jgi:hypothetical protein